MLASFSSPFNTRKCTATDMLRGSLPHIQQPPCPRALYLVMYANDLSKSMHGFLWDDGKVTSVPVPASMNNGINDHGAVVGFYENLTTNMHHSYLLRKGVRTPIDFPGAVHTLAQDINNHGRVVGFYRAKDSSFHGFLWHKGKFTSVDIPGAVNGTFVVGINSVGDIVGEYDDATTAHGFLLHWRDYEDKDSDDDAGN